MKICHVVHAYEPAIGGSQKLMKHLSEQLVAQYGDDVTVFTTTAYHTEQLWEPGSPMLPAGTEIVNGVTVRRFPVFNRLRLLRRAAASAAYRLRLPGNDWLRTLETGPIMPGLAQAIAESGADIVFATAFPLLHMYTALNAAHQSGIPVVLLGALHPADTWGFDRPIIFRAIQQADAYIAHTDFERDYVIEHSVSPDKITVIGGGVDTTPFLSMNSHEAREQFGFGDAPVIATLGRQMARKRLDTLLAAMDHVWQTHPDARLLIAGAEGDFTTRLQTLINTLPPDRQAHVAVVTDFPDTDKPALLAACDVFVLASGEESFGIAFVEAWACDKPVVGARLGAIESLIEDGKDGLLFTYEDPASLAQALNQLISNPARRQSMGEAGRRKVAENYTWEIIARRVRDVYAKLSGV